MKSGREGKGGEGKGREQVLVRGLDQGIQLDDLVESGWRVCGSIILTGADERANAIGWKVAAQMHARIVGRRAYIVLILGELVILREAASQMRVKREGFRDAFLIKIKLETQTDRQKETERKKKKRERSTRERERERKLETRERERAQKEVSKLTIFI